MEALIGFIAPLNDAGYKAQILYSDKSSSVAYYVSGKNKQALAAYKDEVEKLLTDAHGVPRKIVVANTEIKSMIVEIILCISGLIIIV